MNINNEDILNSILEEIENLSVPDFEKMVDNAIKELNDEI